MMIHVCYGINDKDGHYSKFVGTSIASIFENTKEEVTIHILCDNTMTTENHDNFIYLAGRYGQQIKFYNVETLAHREIEYISKTMSSILNSRYTIGTLYRVIIPSLIDKSVNKIIYLDADILVNLDINEMWKINLDNKPLAAVPESVIGLTFNDIVSYLNQSHIVKYEKYFNAGVLILNLDYIRKNYFKVKESYDIICKFLSEKRNCSFDQDVLNYAFAEDALHLPAKYNVFVMLSRFLKRPVIPALYHYVSENLTLDTHEVYSRLYFSYFEKTRWFNIDMLGNISNTILNTLRQNQLTLIKWTKLISRKSRAFFVESHNLEVLKNIFGISSDEKIIVNTPPPFCR